MKRKSLGVSNERYLKIEKCAVDITSKTGKVTSWSDVVNYMIDNYLNDAQVKMTTDFKNSNPK